MFLTIEHDTTYSYDQTVSYTIQSLRLTPQPYDGQRVRSWSVDASGGGMLSSFTDSFGNLTHTLVIDRPHTEVTIRVRGKVETRDTNGIVSGAIEPFPALFYLRDTEQTKANGAIRALALAAKSGATGELDALHRLMAGIREAVDYKPGQTDTMTTAVEALDNGAGVCQDHAHIFIAAARSIDVPARYVSGYLLHTDTGAECEASHAWAEALVPDLGWVGFDVANCVCPTEQYVRIGFGLDYREAAPVRGVRRGGGDEQMTIAVRVAQSGAAAQQ